MRVQLEDVRGVFAIMPTPATPDAADPATRDSVDYEESARAAHALVDGGVDAILTNGTFGEGATLRWAEAEEFARVVVESVDGRVPVFVGATTLNTRDTIDRATRLSELGVDGLLLGRPMWSPCDDAATIGFYRDVAAAVPDLGIIVYDNPISFRGKIPSAVYAELAGIPQIIAAKCPPLGPSFAADLDAVDSRMRLLPVERDWHRARAFAPDDVVACWSGSASCGPAAATALRDAILAGDEALAETISARYAVAAEGFFPRGSFELFSTYNVQLEKIRIDAAGFIAAGPCRPPYTECPEEFAEGARASGRKLAALHRDYGGA